MVVVVVVVIMLPLPLLSPHAHAVTNISAMCICVYGLELDLLVGALELLVGLTAAEVVARLVCLGVSSSRGGCSSRGGTPLLV